MVKRKKKPNKFNIGDKVCIHSNLLEDELWGYPAKVKNIIFNDGESPKYVFEGFIDFIPEEDLRACPF